jgi:3-hydroxyacyl-[acyl-carrier-protein] dehydratase
MRWMWIDRVIELKPKERLIAIKHLSMAEEHLHDHFPATATRPQLPVMPMSLIVEGMAQSAGILVGHANDFKEKVVLAKVAKASLTKDPTPGCTLRYTATIDRFTDNGASTKGTVDLYHPEQSYLDDQPAQPERIGEIDLIFSHLDRNSAGTQYPKENFVFSDSFRTILRTSGIESSF